MLHILWIIIKFILILLGILLGLVLLAVLLVLFCPIRYRVSIAKETEDFKETEAAGKISWLFGGLSLRFWFKDGRGGKEFRLFGLPARKLLKKFKNRRAEEKEEPQEQKRKKIKKSKSRSPEEAPEKITVSVHNISEEQQTEKTKTAEQSSAEKSSAEKVSEEDDEQRNIRSRQKKKPHENEKISGDGPKEASGSSDEASDPAVYRFFYKLGNKARSFLEKLKRIGAVFGTISDGIHSFKLTIENIYAKINWWKRFLTHPKIQAALILVKDELIRLLKHMFPTKIEGNITFSCTDPSITGTILAVLGATIPLHKNCIQVNPQFEDRNMVVGTAKMKGRIYGIVLIAAALKIYFNKDIKYTIKIWKKHKED